MASSVLHERGAPLVAAWHPGCPLSPAAPFGSRCRCRPAARSPLAAVETQGIRAHGMELLRAAGAGWHRISSLMGTPSPVWQHAPARQRRNPFALALQRVGRSNLSVSRQAGGSSEMLERILIKSLSMYVQLEWYGWGLVECNLWGRAEQRRHGRRAGRVSSLCKGCRRLACDNRGVQPSPHCTHGL